MPGASSQDKGLGLIETAEYDQWESGGTFWVCISM